MRILICTQAVDRDDPVLSFFHGWLLEFAKHFERIEVICLKEGRHSLPENVFVHSLGKPGSRVKYVYRFYKYITRFQSNYDAVFVHMNQEYVLLGAFLWRSWRKKIILWRNHKEGSLFTRLAAKWAHKVCYTSPQAYVANFENAIQMPIGIDTNIFRPSEIPPEPNSLLFLGRLDPVKNPGIFCEAVAILNNKNVSTKADIYGDPTPGRGDEADNIKKKYGNLPNLTFHSAIPNQETSALYSSHSIYVNLTLSGSFDKTIGEAMASGCIVIAANDVVRNAVPSEYFVDINAESVANATKAALGLSPERRSAITSSQKNWIIREHSLSLLVSRLIEMIRR